jgi:hypothetical protein
VDPKDQLVLALDRFCDSIVGPQLSRDLVEVWASALAGRTVSADEAAAGFRAHKEEAERLYVDGKLGAAIDRMMRAVPDFKRTHEKEIDAFVYKLSDELTAKWDADVERVKQLARAGDVDEALQLLKKAEVYGDGKIREDAAKLMVDIQNQALVGRKSAKKPAGEDEGAELEAELKEFSGQDGGGGQAEGSEEN